ncbi:FAD dependent oxidoreductase family protein 3 [Achromobacter xylosoxidans A8]|uniref:FAD dependent oxidoreductase family protein 3 n=1 Tax=Achromobacter xylosoxidans (strain A8) TaxID=762376 RepID=E3HPG7_ACHXA|nr:FAD-dependent oxidoreductase [Achromobacter xylosoxidans]ADP14652.1 FAD dependent oxidoreductase family protein 3 [Achromobacter xylosoxidans A8]
MTAEPLYDYAVIGAGIAGASVAYRLSATASVAVLEREAQPGYHSTGRSAAMFMETYGTAQIKALTRASRAFYENPPQGFSEHPLLSPRGVLYIATPEQQDLLREVYDDFRSQSPNVTLIDAAQAVERVPCLRGEQICGAIEEPDARDIDVHALHQGFLRGMTRQGAVLHNQAEVVSAAHADGVWTLTLSDGRSLRARALVNAAGAWADHAAALCGASPVGLQPCRRTAFTFSGPPDVDFAHWPAVVGVDESYYFKPDAGQLLGSPANADPVAAHDVVPEELDVATGIYRIETATSLTIRRPKHTWAGLRSFVRDGDFVVGWDADAPAFFWLAAQGGYGIQTAAATSELAAALLTRQPLPAHLHAHGVDAEAVRPARLR